MTEYTENDSLTMIYIYRTSDLLEQLEQLILSGEGVDSFSPSSINEVFRIMHTLKGSSSMMMYQSITKLAHTLEDIFYYLREEDPKQVDYSLVSDLVLEGIDFIKFTIEKISAGESAEVEDEGLFKKMQEFLIDTKRKNAY